MSDEISNSPSSETIADPSAVEELVISFKKEGSLQSKVYALLQDQQWHCQECEGKPIGSNQYAGGGGIQGLQRGTRMRPGIVIEITIQFCPPCARNQRGDRWTGILRQANAAANIPPALIARVLQFYNYTDVIEQRRRAQHELIIDHRFPMERWGGVEPANSPAMSDEEIKRKFQLLKKDEGGNHNLLKSRACETCLKTGKRGEPFGIPFWYGGTENWPETVPQRGIEAEAGCVGCGWYDFESWRQALRQVAPLLNELNQKAAETAPSFPQQQE